MRTDLVLEKSQGTWENGKNSFAEVQNDNIQNPDYSLAGQTDS